MPTVTEQSKWRKLLQPLVTGLVDSLAAATIYMHVTTVTVPTRA